MASAAANVDLFLTCYCRFTEYLWTVYFAYIVCDILKAPQSRRLSIASIWLSTCNQWVIGIGFSKFHIQRTGLQWKVFNTRSTKVNQLIQKTTYNCLPKLQFEKFKIHSSWLTHNNGNHHNNTWNWRSCHLVYRLLLERFNFVVNI